MKRFILLLFSLLVILWGNAQNNGTFYFSNLNLKDGLSQISVLKILQDSKGFMWFATRNGLNRYDGSEFIIYRHVPGDSLSLSDNYIISLAEDHNHNLWIGTSRGLNKLDLKTNRIKQYTNEKYGALAKTEIRSLLVDSRLSVGGTVAVSQHPFDVGLSVEDFAAQLNVGYPPFVAVILKCSAAHFQPCRHLLVREETLPVQCRAVAGSQMLYVVQQTVKTAHEVDYPLVVFVNQFVHITLDLVELLSLLYSVIRLSCL